MNGSAIGWCFRCKIERRNVSLAGSFSTGTSTLTAFGSNYGVQSDGKLLFAERVLIADLYFLNLKLNYYLSP